ncbi:MAG: hypothetical protein EON47_15415 [Acetobacteraceae bacterium]|nr:MAG: hypothetical protein EON47_15415 [Acetobacteraceae bacterium]
MTYQSINPFAAATAALQRSEALKGELEPGEGYNLAVQGDGLGPLQRRGGGGEWVNRLISHDIRHFADPIWRDFIYCLAI